VGLGRVVYAKASAELEPLKSVKQVRGGLVFKAHRLLYHSNLGLRVIKKKIRAAQMAPRWLGCPVKWAVFMGADVNKVFLLACR